MTEAVGAALRRAAERIGVPWARTDAELLMAHALGVSRQAMLLSHMQAPVPPGFAALLARRLDHEPVAYILGDAEFYGRTFAVSPAVLIPRGDSESVIAAALAAAPQARSVLDCGTGSGILLLTALAELPAARGTGIDRSTAALEIAVTNAAALGLEDRARLLCADWTEPGWGDALGRFDLILANPPYVEADAALDPSVRGREPDGALFAGTDGLADYRVLVPQIPALLAPGGVAVIEIGASQAAAVAAIAAAAGLSAQVHRDLGGRDRAVEMRPISSS